MTDIREEQLIREIKTLKHKVAVLAGQGEQRIPKSILTPCLFMVL